MNTPTPDRNETIDMLNDLVQTSLDGEAGFTDAAEFATDDSLKQRCSRHAQECRQAATELQGMVQVLGGKPADSRSLAATARRSWAAVKGSVAGYTDIAILDEAEREADEALDAYRQAADAALPDEVHAVVARHCESVERHLGQLRMLRDHARRSGNTGHTG